MSKSEYMKEWHRKNKEHSLAYGKNYYKNNQSKAKAACKRWRDNNREYNAKRNTKWRTANRDKVAVANKKTYLKYRDRRLLECRDYGKRNRDRISARNRAYTLKNKEKIIARQRNWYKQNAHKAIAGANRRRTKILNSTVGNVAVILAWEQSWRSKPTVNCYWCLGVFPPDKCASDHMNPLFGGGSHSIENLCISCSSCNSRKFTKPMVKWIQELDAPTFPI